MPLLGELSALLTACCWSCSALAFSAATLRVGSTRLNLTRLVLAASFLAATVFLVGIDVRLSSSQIRNLALSGLVGLAFGDTFLYKSYEYIGARVSSLIMSIAPAISAVLAYVVLGEVLSIFGAVGMAVTLGGIALVVLERRDGTSSRQVSSLLGIFYGVLAAVGQGGGLVLAKAALAEGHINGFVASLTRISASLVLLVPLFIARYGSRDLIRTFHRDPRAFGLTALGAFLGPYLGITLSFVAVTYTKVGIAATLMATVPIVMLPMVKYIGKEILSWRAIAGAFAAVAGVGIIFLR